MSAECSETTRAAKARVERDIATPGLNVLMADYFNPSGSFAGMTFDTLGVNPPNEITTDDLLAVTLLDVRFPAPAVRRLLETDSRAASELLAEISPETDMWEESDRTQAIVNELWQLLIRGRDGVGQTRASKLLARKRPRLIPITDSVIVKRIGVPRGETWPAMRHSLEDEQLRRGIERLRPSTAQTATVLRLLDVALWMLNSQSRLARKARASAGVVV